MSETPSNAVPDAGAPASGAGMGWLGIVRLGLVQTALGAIVVLLTSTINRVMVVELALPAIVPGLLVGVHYAMQMLRPAWGYGSDVSGRRTPWILGGMATLAAGAIGAACATYWTALHPWQGLALATVSFTLVGAGAGAAGTSLLAMLATSVAPARRAAAATTVWIMMILGFVISAPLAGHFLDPYSHGRLVAVTSCVAISALALATIAVLGVERGARPLAAKRLAAHAHLPAQARKPFRQVFLEVWSEPAARRFTIFIFVSMLAYSMQDLVLEPFAGLVFAMSPGATTKMSGVQHAGVLVGMITVAVAASAIGGPILGSLRLWTVAGCLGSAIFLLAIAASGYIGPDFPLRAAIFGLGAANGVFAVAAIGTMMAMANAGVSSRQGTRLGLWGAAQGVAFGLGGFLGAAAVDLARYLVGTPAQAFGIVFVIEAAMFVVAAAMANRIGLLPMANERIDSAVNPSSNAKNMVAAGA